MLALTLRNSNLPPQRASLEVSGVPQTWKWALKGDGNEVAAVIVPPNSNETVQLELSPPAGAKGGRIPIVIKARYGSDAIDLPLAISLSDAPKGGIGLRPDLPALKGTARSTFSFKVSVRNNSAQDSLISLAAELPVGFQSSFKRGYGSEEITGILIKAGGSGDVTVNIMPPPSASAGRYRVVMTASNGEAKGKTDLSIDISGEPNLTLKGPQERLSGAATAGEEASFPFTLTNTGGASTQMLEASATVPSGWEWEVTPSTIDGLAPNDTNLLYLRLTPSPRAIAGDYMVTLRTTESLGSGASQSVDFRVTVNTSTMWGAVGLAIIAIAALILTLAVIRYGRR
ncbi:MAG: NEW3 domain-containing protein [Pseudomonadota bacterium]